MSKLAMAIIYMRTERSWVLSLGRLYVRKQIRTLQGEIFRSFSQGALVGFCEAIGEGAIAQITMYLVVAEPSSLEGWLGGWHVG